MKKLLAIALTTCALVWVVVVPSQFVPDSACVSILLRSHESVEVPLPTNCAEKPAMDADETVKYLERERSSRGFTFRGWITCEGAPAGKFAFLNDPRWLPSYVPGTYQFRRTVLIVPFAQKISRASPVKGEICLMPWPKYLQQIAGQCSWKFSGWK